MPQTMQNIFCITSGDQNGICPEITFKAWKFFVNFNKKIDANNADKDAKANVSTNTETNADNTSKDTNTDKDAEANTDKDAKANKKIIFFIICSDNYFANLNNKVPTQSITSPHEAINVFNHAVPVLLIKENNCKLSIDIAFSLCKKNHASALITNPIHKADMIKEGLKFKGHTGYLGQLANRQVIMMMYTDKFSTLALTDHIPLNEVSNFIKQDYLNKKVTLAYTQISKLTNNKSTFAITALNPHAGEEGYIGKEEQEIIIPFLKDFNANKNNPIKGPFASDDIFAKHKLGKYQYIICLYHDQAMLPIKLYAGFEVINITLGLPFLRVSPGHGTARDIVGKSMANEKSLINCLFYADKNHHRYRIIAE